MMLFVICPSCNESIEEQNALDLARFFRWTCPKCFAINPPIATIAEPEQSTADETEEIITVERADAKEFEGMTNLLEGLI